MNTLSKYIKATLFVGLFITVGVLNLHAQQIAIKFVADTTCVTNVDNFKVNMEMQDQELIRVDSFNLTFYFDPAFLQYDTLSYVNPRFLLDTTLIVTHGVDSVNMSWYAKDPAGANLGTANYFHVAFIGKSVGETSLSWSTASIFNNPETGIIPTTSSATDILVHPFNLVYTLQVLDSCCSDESTGRARVIVDEGFSPFQYEWETAPPQYSDYAIGLIPEMNYVTVSDGNGCHNRDSVSIPVIPAPVISFVMTPSPAYIDKPVVAFSNTSEEGTDWIWNFDDDSQGSTERDPVHVFGEAKTYNINLTAFDENGFGCDTTVIEILEIKPPNLQVKDVITPSMNFIIEVGGTEEGGGDAVPLNLAFVSHKLFVVNRYGKRVYETTDLPDTGWDGGNLSDGTYFYVLTCQGIKENYEYKGVVTILGKN